MPLKTIKLAISDEMITQLDSRAAIEGMPRSELIRRTLSGQLHPTVLEKLPQDLRRRSPCNEWQNCLGLK